MKNIILCTLVVLISSCSSYDSKYNKENFGRDTAPSTYTVKKGDSLFSIAWRYGLNSKKIQRLNRISNPNKINVGQKLKLTGKVSKVIGYRKPKPQKNNRYGRGKGWSWPIKGAIVRNFNSAGIGTHGIRISGKLNQAVNATENGVVAYQGDGLNGYGNVVIIKHSSGLLSAYGFLSQATVKEGQKVKKRQKIGTVGYANNKKPTLHFEIRKNGNPTHPKSYIGDKYQF